MQWISPPEKDAASTLLEKCLWDADDQFRANYGPILGLNFLRFANKLYPDCGYP